MGDELSVVAGWVMNSHQMSVVVGCVMNSLWWQAG